MSNKDELEKQEDPTPNRLKKARSKGNIPRSRELTSFSILIFGWILIWFTGNNLLDKIIVELKKNLNFKLYLYEHINYILVNIYLISKKFFFIIFPIIFIIMIITIISSGLLGGWVFSKKSLNIDFSRLNPYKNISRIFSKNVFIEMAKTLFKFFFMLFSCIFYLWHTRFQISDLSDNNYSNAIKNCILIISKCVFVIILSSIPIVFFDSIFQLFTFKKNLRMSKKEVQDENKENEGNPQLKHYIRKKQRHIYNMRMMQNVEKSDVIIVNPTNYAVGLKYEKNMKAPVLLAKGTGNIAIKIKEKAQEKFIPIIAVPPLARAIYKYCNIGEYIPIELYESVAEILTWVYNLKNWKKLGGNPPKKPIGIKIPNYINKRKKRNIVDESK